MPPNSSILASVFQKVPGGMPPDSLVPLHTFTQEISTLSYPPPPQPFNNPRSAPVVHTILVVHGHVVTVQIYYANVGTTRLYY